MRDYKAIKVLLSELTDSISFLSDSDVEKIISGDYQMAIKIQKKKNTTSLNNDFVKNNIDFEKVLNDFNLIEDRQAGAEYLNDKLKTKANFEKFAKSIDVAVMKSDKLEKIRENIIESTIGARLRSEAIQNKNIKDINSKK
ncbi:hypothetical protein GCM10009414_29860 [Tatumella terrea]|uniref:hypothetical protein n=1 Tax=Tatumella terrea TaxID=419007 RepID=UPI0031D07B6C